MNLYSQVPEPVSEQKDHIILFNGIIHDSRFGGYTQYGWVSFKDGKIDLLIVNNMLLTGFDCPRLKKLYVGRIIKAHNLLQALFPSNP